METANVAIPEAYSVREVGKALRVDPVTVRREIERGNLRAKKVGRVFRIPAKALQEYLSPDGGK
mgnify:CR=1 FL=1